MKNKLKVSKNLSDVSPHIEKTWSEEGLIEERKQNELWTFDAFLLPKRGKCYTSNKMCAVNGEGALAERTLRK